MMVLVFVHEIFDLYRDLGHLLKCVLDYYQINSLFGNENKYMNQAATKSINKLFYDFKHFDYSKPINFIEQIIKCSTIKENSIILDFFAGSSTTAHAVLKQNAEDSGNRKYIQVQLP